MRPPLLLLIALAALPGARAQVVPDTTPPARYYPLGVGDAWEYHIVPFPPAPAFEERREIVRDTMISGTPYVVQTRARWSVAQAAWVPYARLSLRYDAATTRVVARHGAEEHAETCPLGAAFGSVVDCLPEPAANGAPEDQEVVGGYGGTVDVGGTAVPVEARKRFDSRMMTWPNVFPEYAAPLGYVRGYGAFCTLCDERLLYARVGGVTYGAPLAAEPAPGADGGLALRATPNPARGPAAVRLVLPAPASAVVAVYDALGRRVAVLHDGPLAAGPSALALDAGRLAPGVYVVRATVGAARASAPLVVR